MKAAQLLNKFSTNKLFKQLFIILLLLWLNNVKNLQAY